MHQLQVWHSNVFGLRFAQIAALLLEDLWNYALLLLVGSIENFCGGSPVRRTSLQAVLQRVRQLHPASQILVIRDMPLYGGIMCLCHGSTKYIQPHKVSTEVYGAGHAP